MSHEDGVSYQTVAPAIPKREQLLNLGVLIKYPQKDLGSYHRHIALQVRPRVLDEYLLGLREYQPGYTPVAGHTGEAREMWSRVFAA